MKSGVEIYRLATLVKVRSLEQAVVFVCNFERPRSDKAPANQMRDRYATLP